MSHLCEYGKVCSEDPLTLLPSSPLIQAEWLAAQKDERTIAGLEEADEEGVSSS